MSKTAGRSLSKNAKARRVVASRVKSTAGKRRVVRNATTRVQTKRSVGKALRS